MFGSGASHAIYALFMARSALANKGNKVGLLRGAGTRMATWFYAMMRVLRHKDVLLSTVHTVTFRDLPKNDRTRAAILDVTDQKFFKALYTLLRAVYPAIRALRYCDKNEPAMDKIYFLAHRASVALERSVSFLDDTELFQVSESDDLLDEALEVFGDGNEEEVPL